MRGLLKTVLFLVLLTNVINGHTQGNASKPKNFYIAKELKPSVLNIDRLTVLFEEPSGNNAIDADENGINGYLVTSKKNGNTIFLPAAGSTNGAAKKGKEGDYWSKTKVSATEEQWRAWRVYFSASEILRYRSNRSCGRSIRPVYVK